MFGRVLSTVLVKVYQKQLLKDALKDNWYERFCKCSEKILLSDAKPEPNQTSKMKFFARMVNELKLLATFTITFTLDVWLGSEYTPANESIFCKIATFTFATLLKAE